MKILELRIWQFSGLFWWQTNLAVTKGIAFKEKYLPHIEEAIIRAAKFASDNEALITDIGCNIWILIKEMQSFEASFDKWTIPAPIENGTTALATVLRNSMQ